MSSDQTVRDESSSETSFDWSDLSREQKLFQGISKKNVEALQAITDNILGSSLFDHKIERCDSFEKIAENFLCKEDEVKRLIMKEPSITSLAEEEKDTIRNCESLKKKISLYDLEIKKYVEDKDNLYKDLKNTERILRRSIKYYETYFDIKLESNNRECEEKDCYILYFSNSEGGKFINIYNINGYPTFSPDTDLDKYQETQTFNDLDTKKETTVKLCAIRNQILHGDGLNPNE